jgi:hypothetical protein
LNGESAYHNHRYSRRRFGLVVSPLEGANTARRRTFTALTICLMCFCQMLFPRSEDISFAADECSDAVRAAARGIRENTRSWSGRGNGTIKQWRGAELVKRMEAQFDLGFSGEKYRIKLNFLEVPGHRPMHERIIVVCDGSAIARAVFSDSIRPNGCRVDIFDGNTSHGMVINATDRAMYFPPQLLPLQFAHGRLLSGELIAREVENGQFLIQTPADPVFEYVVDPKQGWNVIRWTIRGPSEGGKEYEESKTGVWENQRGMWFLREFTEEKGEDAIVTSRIVLRFDEFEVNPVVPDNEFTWKHLDLCADGVVADRRPNALVTAYQNAPSDIDQEKRLETLVERVQRLTPRSGVPSAEETRGRRPWIGLLLLAAMGFALFAYLLGRGA